MLKYNIYQLSTEDIFKWFNEDGIEYTEDEFIDCKIGINPYSIPDKYRNHNKEYIPIITRTNDIYMAKDGSIITGPEMFLDESFCFGEKILGYRCNQKYTIYQSELVYGKLKSNTGHAEFPACYILYNGNLVRGGIPCGSDYNYFWSFISEVQ